jgi:hypothetical protein
MIHSFIIHTVPHTPHINPVTFVSQSMINDVEEISKVLKILRGRDATSHKSRSESKIDTINNQQQSA